MERRRRRRRPPPSSGADAGVGLKPAATRAQRPNRSATGDEVWWRRRLGWAYACLLAMRLWVATGGWPLVQPWSLHHYDHHDHVHLHQGYVHPDEFFQAPEIAATALRLHDKYGKDGAESAHADAGGVQPANDDGSLWVAWEFHPAHACRSIVPPCVSPTSRVLLPPHVCGLNLKHDADPSDPACGGNDLGRLLVSGVPFLAMAYLNATMPIGGECRRH